MSLTTEERREMMAKARSARKLNQVESTEEVITELKTRPAIAPQRYGSDDEVVTIGSSKQPKEQEYGAYVLYIEPCEKGQRVVVLKDGLHKAEWQGEINSCLDRARKFVDTGDMTYAVNVNAN